MQRAFGLFKETIKVREENTQVNQIYEKKLKLNKIRREEKSVRPEWTERLQELKKNVLKQRTIQSTSAWDAKEHELL